MENCEVHQECGRVPGNWEALVKSQRGRSTEKESPVVYRLTLEMHMQRSCHKQTTKDFEKEIMRQATTQVPDLLLRGTHMKQIQLILQRPGKRN